ncbi:MAG: shikimate kinase [Pseudomonadota bacterium]
MPRRPDRQTCREIVRLLDGRSIVFVGIMGAGKTAIGRRLADRLGLKFVDADAEIETAANMTIAEMFEVHGEDYFREGERRVIARLMHDGSGVLSTGGGAFMNRETRERIKSDAISVWLFADLSVLLERVRRRGHRPLLKAADPEAVLADLLAERNPVYEEADIAVESRNGPHDAVVDAVVRGLHAHLTSVKETGERRQAH